MHQIINRIMGGGLPLEPTEHKALLDTRRGLYAALLLLPDLRDRDAAGIITRLLATTKDRSVDDAKREDVLIGEVLPRLPRETVLNAFEKLAAVRVNNRRTSGWIRAYILGSPDLEKWAVSDRKRLRKLLTHAMGRDTVRLVARFLLRETHLDTRRRALLRRNLYRFGTDHAVMRRVFLFLIGDMIAGDGEDVMERIRAEYTASPGMRSYLEARKDLGLGKELPLRVLKGISATYHRGKDLKALRYIARREKERRAVENEQRDENTPVGMARALYRSGTLEPDTGFLNELESEIARLPFWNERVVVLADTSTSMRGFGHRLYNSMAIAGILTEALRRRADAHVIRFPEAEGMFPPADGGTDIAQALVQAAISEPDVIILISDGYENAWEGDAAHVWSALSKMSAARVLHVLPVYTARENTEQRAISGEIPMTAETLEAGLTAAWLRMRLVVRPEASEELLTQACDAIVAVPGPGESAQGRAVETA